MQDDAWLTLVTWVDANAPYHDRFFDKRPRDGSDPTRKVVPRSRLIHRLDDGADRVLGRLVETRAIIIRKARRGKKGDAENEALILSTMKKVYHLQEKAPCILT